MEVELTISFSLVSCACGADRQAGQRCPICNCEPVEVDDALERRRAIVRGVGEREAKIDGEPLALEEAFSVVGGWFDRFFAAYEGTSEGAVDAAVARLSESLMELNVLHRRAARSRRLRPNHAIWATLDSVLAAYDNIRDTYLDALTAATLDEAERAAGRGQNAIDAAGAALDRFNALAAAWQSVHDVDPSDEHADVFAGAEAIVDLTGTSDMLELDRRGAELFGRIAGGDVACPSGFGVRLQLLNLAVEGSMDPARLWPTARRVYLVLAKHAVALRGLFADVDWRADLLAVSLEVRDAGFEASAVAAAAGANRRRLVQSALRLAARQIERAAHPLLATLLAIEARQPYVSKRRRDIGELLTQTAQAGHEDLLLGLDPKLRRLSRSS